VGDGESIGARLMSVIPGRRDDKGKEGALCITPRPGNPQKSIEGGIAGG